MDILLKLAIAVAALVVVFWLALRVVRSARRLDEGIEEYREEEEGLLRSDPYSALSQLSTDEQKDKETRDK